VASIAFAFRYLSDYLQPTARWSNWNGICSIKL